MVPDTLLEALMLAKETRAIAKKNKIPLVICPPYIYTIPLQKKAAFLGAQAVSPYIDMPHTGEISPRMLQKIGVSYAIVGHSERRHTFYENNTSIQQAVVHLTDKKIIPIICVGEQTRDSKGAYLDFVKARSCSYRKQK
jgi:triosephosphate isomerase